MRYKLVNFLGNTVPALTLSTAQRSVEAADGSKRPIPSETDVLRAGVKTLMARHVDRFAADPDMYGGRVAEQKYEALDWILEQLPSSYEHTDGNSGNNTVVGFEIRQSPKNHKDYYDVGVAVSAVIAVVNGIGEEFIPPGADTSSYKQVARLMLTTFNDDLFQMENSGVLRAYGLAPENVMCGQ